MPTSNYVPDYVVNRYCNVCYRLAELQVHCKGAARQAMRGLKLCRWRYEAYQGRCQGMLSIKPKKMRAMMVEQNRARVGPPRSISNLLDDETYREPPYNAYDPAELAHRERLEAERMWPPSSYTSPNTYVLLG